MLQFTIQGKVLHECFLKFLIYLSVLPFSNLMGTCSYSGLADDYNFCRFAHSEDELREWKERHRMKMQEKSYGYKQRDVKVTETQSPWTAMPRQQDTYPKTPSTQQIPSTTGSLGIPSRGSQVSSTPVSRATNQPIQPPPLQNTIPNTTTQTAAEISVPMVIIPSILHTWSTDLVLRFIFIF